MDQKLYALKMTSDFQLQTVQVLYHNINSALASFNYQQMQLLFAHMASKNPPVFSNAKIEISWK